MQNEKESCRKNPYQKVGFERKLLIIDEILNGQISLNYASKKYNISRSSISYWIDKYSRIDQKKRNMSKDKEITKLKARIQELEFIKDFQQDVIADMENITGLDIAKKSLPGTLVKEIAKKKISRLK